MHKTNLYAWVGAVTKFFYDYHLQKLDGKKKKLTAKVKAFGTDLMQDEVKEIDESHLTTFKTQAKYYAKRSIRIELKSAKEKVGVDTHFHLVSDPPPPVVSATASGETTQTSNTSASKKRRVGNNVAEQQTGNPSQAVNGGAITQNQSSVNATAQAGHAAVSHSPATT